MIRLALIAIFAFAFSIHSRADDIQFPADSQLISWDQFQKLSPERKAAYVEELRILMMEIEELQIRRAEIDPQLHLSSHASFEFLNSFVEPHASALDRSCMGPVFVRNASGFCVTRASQVGWSRPSPSVLSTRGSGSAGKVPLFQGNVQTRHPNLWARSTFFDQPSGSDASRACVTNVINWNDPFALKGGGPAQVAARHPKQTAVAAGKTAAHESAGHRVSHRRPAAAPAKTSSSSDGSPASGSSAPVGKSTVDYSEIAALKAETCRADSESAPERTGLTCGRPEIESARTEFSKNYHTCIIGGNFRSYKDGRAETRACQPIHEWCASNEDDPADCRVAVDPANRVPAVFRCSPGQTLCNPLLFGVHETDQTGAGHYQPYCGPRAGSITRSCYELAKADQDASNGGTSHHVELVTLKGEIAMDGYIKHDAHAAHDEKSANAAEEQAAAIQKMWKKLVEDLSMMCFKPGPPRQVFCEECHWIRKRLRDMHRLAEGTDELSACMKFNEDTAQFTNEVEAGAAAGAAVGATVSIAPVDATGMTVTNGKPPARATSSH